MYKIAEINVSIDKEIKKIFVPLFSGEFDTLKKEAKKIKNTNKYKYPKGYYPINSDRFFYDIKTAENRIKKHKIDYIKEQTMKSNLGICKIHEVD